MCLELEKGITEAISTPCLLSMMAYVAVQHHWLPPAAPLLQNRAQPPSPPCPHTDASESNAAQAWIAGRRLLFMRTKGPQAGETRGAIQATVCSVYYCYHTFDGSRFTRNRRTAPTKELMPPCPRPPTAAIACRL